MASGANAGKTYIQAGEESTYANEAAAINVAFGKGQTYSKTGRRNITQVRGTGSRNPEALVEGKFDGSGSINWTVCSGYFLKLAFGAVANAGSGPYTHKYTEADETPSFTTEIGMAATTGTSVFKLLGCKCNNITITVGENAPVTASMEVIYADEEEGTTYDDSAATDSEAPFGFGLSKITIDGVTIDRMRNWSFSMGNNAILIHGTESQTASAALDTTRGYSLTLNPNYEQATRLWEVMSGSGTGIATTGSEKTMAVILDNGLSTTSSRKIHIDMLNSKIDDHTVSFESPEDLVREGVTFIAKSGSATATDNTATDPW